ncbi:hypothetical protein J3R30DRAFT_3406489 [Lentinula aciculospora]|uniref:DUF6534 domain-containing protein n=1 Tax=Lentinula aciculospora TaxID=153920 RepID=A0A9W9DJI5_9AGAR|nr:hypothetical protein J3R30DRAFT_3406489 [Lentinula aciculospora]
MADVSSSSSSIPYETVASTLGIWIIAFFLATILYGMGILQAWLYFHWYPKDGWKLKSLIVVIVLLETVQVATFFAATYNVLIRHFGNWVAVLDITWRNYSQVEWLRNTTLGFHDSNRTIISGSNGNVPSTFISSFAQIDTTTWIYSLLSASTFTCDVLIASALYVTLSGQRIAGAQYFPTRSNTIIRKLTIYAINRGVLTAVAALINLILFLTIQNTFYYFIGLLTSSKLYMNSMLAALNSRQYISQSSEDEAARCWNTIPIQVLDPEPRTARATTSSRGYNEELSEWGSVDDDTSQEGIA